MSPDVINAGFEFVGALTILMSAYKCYCNKSAAGIHWGMVAFMTGWGFWNLFFYGGLEQHWSFWAGVFMLLSNLLYVGLLIRYTFLKKPVDSVLLLE